MAARSTIGSADRRQPLVVFTHGACVDHHSFDPAVPSVAQRYRVLTWDVRGHGRSQPIGAPFGLPLAVDDLLALVDQLGYATAVYVGHSNGTYIAQELAFRHPERVQALVIADGDLYHLAAHGLGLLAAQARGRRDGAHTLRDAQAGRSDVHVGQPGRPAVRLCGVLAADESDLRMHLEGAGQRAAWGPGLPDCAAAAVDARADDALGDIKRIAPQWAAREPNCAYVVIPNARHMAVLDNPAFFTHHVLAFLERWAG